MEFWFRMNYHLVSRLFTSILASFVFSPPAVLCLGAIFYSPWPEIAFWKVCVQCSPFGILLVQLPLSGKGRYHVYRGLFQVLVAPKFLSCSAWHSPSNLGHLDVPGFPVFLSCMACHAPFGSVRSSLLFWLGIMVKGALVRAKGDDAKAH